MSAARGADPDLVPLLDSSRRVTLGIVRILTLTGSAILLAGQLAFAAGPPTTRSPAPAPKPSSRPALAPADTYFGAFGMSPLSIRTMIGLLGRQYHYRTISDRDLLRKALVTEDALRKWRAQYPADPWLAPTFFHLEQLYQAVQTEEARKHATAILNDVVRNYPDTKEGHLSRARLAAGFPPLARESPLAASPAPAPAPTPAESPSAGAGAPDQSPSPGAASSPAPAGSAAPFPSI
jgi:hypothetical protein